MGYRELRNRTNDQQSGESAWQALHHHQHHHMVENGISNPPRAFNSCAQPRMRSCTSSGATSVRSQASVHLGFAGIKSVAVEGLDCFLEALASLLRKTREKNAGMLSWADARDR